MHRKVIPVRSFVLIVTLYLVNISPMLSQDVRIANREEIETFLKLHNYYRHEVGVDSLKWSDDLAEYAMEWARVLGAKYDCSMRHRPKHGRYAQQYGENIYIMWGAEPEIEHVLKNWAEEEKKYYKQEPIGSVKSKKTTGHYTQVIWKTTQRVGCARVKCPKNRGTYIWVCNYDPPGNWVGKKPY